LFSWSFWNLLFRIVWFNGVVWRLFLSLVIFDKCFSIGQGISSHSTMLLSLLGTVVAWQVTTMTKLALVVEVWVGGGGTFHGCVTYPRLMMIPKGIYFGLWGDLWELMIPKRICFEDSNNNTTSLSTWLICLKHIVCLLIHVSNVWMLQKHGLYSDYNFFNSWQ
jgi:hypothetical protein